MEPNFGWDLPAGVSDSDFDEEAQPRRTWRQRLWLLRYDLFWRIRRACGRIEAQQQIGNDPFLPDFPDEA